MKIDSTHLGFIRMRGALSDFNRDIKEVVKESGFTCAVTGVPTPVTLGADLYELGRIEP